MLTETETTETETDFEGTVNDAEIQSLIESMNKLIPKLLSIANNKLSGHEYFQKVLKNPKTVVAPMVDHSFLAFRTLCRRHGADLCYTPMLHAKNFAVDKTYRAHFFTTDEGDQPLVVQFCANQPEVLLAAARYVEGCCQAVDINLGCPQRIARKGNYGAFLMDQPEGVYSLVNLLHKCLTIPVFCKMRVFPKVEDTIKFALMLQSAGCQTLTVHGRTKEQKGHVQGMADWDQIKAVKEALDIPVISNGNIQEYSDVEKCLKYTGCDAVMSAESLLYNPALFSNRQVDPIDICNEYMDIVELGKEGTMFKYVRSHILRILKPHFDVHPDDRNKIHKIHTISDTRVFIEKYRGMKFDHNINGNGNSIKYINDSKISDIRAKRDAKREHMERTKAEDLLGAVDILK